MLPTPAPTPTFGLERTLQSMARPRRLPMATVSLLKTQLAPTPHAEHALDCDLFALVRSGHGPLPEDVKGIRGHRALVAALVIKHDRTVPEAQDLAFLKHSERFGELALKAVGRSSIVLGAGVLAAAASYGVYAATRHVLDAFGPYDTRGIPYGAIVLCFAAHLGAIIAVFGGGGLSVYEIRTLRAERHAFRLGDAAQSRHILLGGEL